MGSPSLIHPVTTGLHLSVPPFRIKWTYLPNHWHCEASRPVFSNTWAESQNPPDYVYWIRCYRNYLFLFVTCFGMEGQIELWSITTIILYCHKKDMRTNSIISPETFLKTFHFDLWVWKAPHCLTLKKANVWTLCPVHLHFEHAQAEHSWTGKDCSG